MQSDLSHCEWAMDLILDYIAQLDIVVAMSGQWTLFWITMQSDLCCHYECTLDLILDYSAIKPLLSLQVGCKDYSARKP